MNVAIKILK